MNSTGLSPKEWAAKKKQFKYLLLARGMKQTEIAKELGVTPKTLCKWKKAMKLGKPWQRVFDESKNNGLQDDIPSFLEFLKLTYPKLYIPTETAYKQYLKTI